MTIVSAATATEADRRRHHRSLAGLSRRGSHLVMASGGHYLHYTDPDQVVEIVRTATLR